MVATNIASRPVPSHPIPSPPGIKYKYVAQAFGKSSCSAGTIVNTVWECMQAALALKGSSAIKDVGSWAGYPKGCTAVSDGLWYFNTHSTGGTSAKADESPVCKVKIGIPHTLRTQTLSKSHITSPRLRHDKQRDDSQRYDKTPTLILTTYIMFQANTIIVCHILQLDYG